MSLNREKIGFVYETGCDGVSCTFIQFILLFFRMSSADLYSFNSILLSSRFARNVNWRRQLAVCRSKGLVRFAIAFAIKVIRIEVLLSLTFDRKVHDKHFQYQFGQSKLNITSSAVRNSQTKLSIHWPNASLPFPRSGHEERFLSVFFLKLLLLASVLVPCRLGVCVPRRLKK